MTDETIKNTRPVGGGAAAISNGIKVTKEVAYGTYSDAPADFPAPADSRDGVERHARAIFAVSLAGEGLTFDDSAVLTLRDRAAIRAVATALSWGDEQALANPPVPQPCEHCGGNGYSGGVVPREPELCDACEVCLGSGVTNPPVPAEPSKVGIVNRMRWYAANADKKPLDLAILKLDCDQAATLIEAASAPVPADVAGLVERLKKDAHETEAASKMMADAKTARQGDREDAEGPGYDWLRAEQTVSWEAATRLASLAAEVEHWKEQWERWSSAAAVEMRAKEAAQGEVTTLHQLRKRDGQIIIDTTAALEAERAAKEAAEAEAARLRGLDKRCSCAEIYGEDPRCFKHGRGTAWRKANPDLCHLLDRAEQAEEALRPFADAVTEWGDDINHPDQRDVWEHPIAMLVTLGAFRLARATLAPKASDAGEVR
jgi:hypothetical protein